MTRHAENDAFASSRCGDLLPERRVFHVREFPDMMHFARQISRATTFASLSMEPIKYIRSRLCEVRDLDVIDGIIKLGQAIEMFQRENLDAPLLPVHFEASSKPIPFAKPISNLIDREPELEG